MPRETEDIVREAFKKAFYEGRKVHSPIFTYKRKKFKVNSKCGSKQAKHFGSIETVDCKKCLARMK